MADLKPCPFCGCSATILAVYRDWWRLRAEHDAECIIADDHEVTVPQDPENREWLIQAWNRRHSADNKEQ